MFEIRPAHEWVRLGRRKGAARKLFGELWRENDLSIMFADTGVGKSMLAVQIADSIVRGKRVEPFEMTARPQPVLVLDFEMTHGQFRDRYSAKESFGAEAGRGHELQRGLLRAQIQWEGGLPERFRNFSEFVHASIIQSLEEHDVRVLIVDNISWLAAGSFAAEPAIRLMKGLKQLKSDYEISILVLAHTTKRNDTAPLTIDDLAGSKMLANFADNVFAIGRSGYDPEIRYLKQLKQRNSLIRHDGSNVAVFRIIADTAFPRFEFFQFGREAAYLRRNYDTHFEYGYLDKTPSKRAEAIRSLHRSGLSHRQIAERLRISKTTVTRYLAGSAA